MDILKFSPWQSSVEAAFWQELGSKKLEELKLSEDPVQVSAFQTALPRPRQGYSRVSGTLYNLNTLEKFKTFDRKEAARKVADSLWDCVSSHRSADTSSALCSFLLVTFVDLKSYQYHYWFAFPVLKPPSAFTSAPPQSLEDAMGEEKSRQILEACADWSSNETCSPAWVLSSTSKSVMECVRLDDWDGTFNDDALLCVLDPSHHPSHPGWILRNILFLIAYKCTARSIKVLCIREKQGLPDSTSSLILLVDLPTIEENWHVNSFEFLSGWEANAEGRKLPRFMDMRSQFDPSKLAEEAVNLNLRLMLWRAAPNLDTTKIAESKCLLLGMGTLGCMVARTLLGWGIRNLSLVDSGRVSFSNPVRQCLYEFDDCLEGGRIKSECAAEHLTKIFPSVNIASYDFSIPMPGHPPRSAEETSQQEEAASTLHSLIADHDVVFLLMDTRESRWLPTLLCACEAMRKLVINIALGFDGFLAMRHGIQSQNNEGKQLGCYFCNDVVAPLNSVADRPLDQQCTVARPGLAPIASAIGVEMMVALLQHPLGGCAPSIGADGTLSEGAFGGIPHMVRGSLLGFSQTCMEGQSFSQCTACSRTVTEAYEEEGYDFVARAIQDPKILEDLTGLTQLAAEMATRLGKLTEPCSSDDDDDDADDDDWTAL